MLVEPEEDESSLEDEPEEDESESELDLLPGEFSEEEPEEESMVVRRKMSVTELAQHLPDQYVYPEKWQSQSSADIHADRTVLGAGLPAWGYYGVSTGEEREGAAI